MNRAAVEAQLAELPLAEFVWFETAELEFSERIRTVCRENCPRYNKTWACPPAVGSRGGVRARCLSYPQGLLITSLTEVADIADTEAALATRGPHEELTRQVSAILRAQGAEVYGLHRNRAPSARTVPGRTALPPTRTGCFPAWRAMASSSRHWPSATGSNFSTAAMSSHGSLCYCIVKHRTRHKPGPAFL